MEANFWHDLWDSGVVGFHQSETNPFLTSHWSTLGLAGQGRVLVPLCGKSRDMIWLASQGHAVLGVELSPKAVNEFFAENNLTAKRLEHDRFVRYELEAMTLLCGDFFQLNTADCQGVTAVYDRAAIVALPPQMRAAYAAHLQNILPKGTAYLMVTMEYDQTQMSGPPFSVTEEEVRHLFADFSRLQKVQEVRFMRKGVETVERVFVMQS